MTPRVIGLLFAGFLSAISCIVQGSRTPMPEKLVIARRTFFDFGPPNDFYELISVTRTQDGLTVERILVTPEGQACVQPAKVESRRAVLHEPMEEFLHGKNPCAIPQKDLHRELKRCKHCLTFSGVNVAMLASCVGKEQQIRMDILDRDLFDPRTATPENTSWTMQVLSEVDRATGPGAMEQPMFATGTETKVESVPETELFHALRDGRFNGLFGNDSTLTEAVHDAQDGPPPPPTIELVETIPFSPVEAIIPKIYPPIGRLARVEGVVAVQADIDTSGKVIIKSADGPKMLQGAASEAIRKWIFPEAAFGHSEEVKVQFKLNCTPHIHTNVN